MTWAWWVVLAVLVVGSVLGALSADVDDDDEEGPWSC